MKKYLLNVAIGFDLFANTVFRGNAGETISGRAGRAASEGKLWGRFLSFVLNTIQPGHIQKALAHDSARAAAVEYLDSKAH
jgi:hypothetical protein